MIGVVVGLAVMAAALLAIPLGVPGLWIMIAVLAVAWLFGALGLPVLLACVLIAAGAELLEFVIVQRLNVRYGGSRLAFWGAIIGGIAGVLIGIPVPIAGPVIAGFLGTFAGAAAATLYETRRLGSATRVGWGVLLGRVWAAATKVVAGIAILVLGGMALLV